jgi:hypothetical protein
VIGDTFGVDCCILVQGVTKNGAKTFEFRDGIPLGIKTCVRVAHRYGDRRMPKRLLGCHYIRSSFQEPGTESVPQRMPRYTVDSGLLACNQNPLLDQQTVL